MDDRTLEQFATQSRLNTKMFDFIQNAQKRIDKIDEVLASFPAYFDNIEERFDTLFTMHRCACNRIAQLEEELMILRKMN
jgi:hypothetical protein